MNACARNGSAIMGYHLKSWRRKFGVVTLVLECVFAVLLVRNSVAPDMIAFGGDAGPTHFLVSCDYAVFLIALGDPTTRPLNFVWGSYSVESAHNRCGYGSVEWLVSFGGCGLAQTSSG